MSKERNGHTQTDYPTKKRLGPQRLRKRRLRLYLPEDVGSVCQERSPQSLFSRWLQVLSAALSTSLSMVSLCSFSHYLPCICMLSWSKCGQDRLYNALAADFPKRTYTTKNHPASCKYSATTSTVSKRKYHHRKPCIIRTLQKQKKNLYILTGACHQLLHPASNLCFRKNPWMPAVASCDGCFRIASSLSLEWSIDYTSRAIRKK